MSNPTEPTYSGPEPFHPHLRVPRSLAVSRLNRFTSRDIFKEVNLTGALNRAEDGSSEAVRLEVYSVPDLKRIPFSEAIKAEYKPTKVGESFGPAWSTHWFRVHIQVPAAWRGKPGVEFQWDADSEGMIWTEDGQAIQGLTGGPGVDRRVEYILPKGTERLTFFLEMACNGMFGVGNGGLINPPLTNRYYRLDRACLVLPHLEARALYHDFDILRQLTKDMPADSAISALALKAATTTINAFQVGDDASIDQAREVSKQALKRSGASRLHHLTAIGHCHIDTAWLWPFDETRRKTARSWATQIRLMDEYPEHRFCASQAQQWEWLQQDYPELFKRISDKVHDGRFMPIGGTWVEMDCNIPSGEALIRQFLYGQRYFIRELGVKSRVFWLPDTFGYSAQLPQIIRGFGMEYFFTQKLSWNNINKYPNTTFDWVGLDGSQVLTHMAPVETYCAQINVGEVNKSVRNNQDRNHCPRSLVPFGNGDGGGGPLPAMLERLRRLRDVDGLPATMDIGDVEEFYDALSKEKGPDLPNWKGELYFELHRGTYTSHGAIKKGNRYSELLMREIEFVSTLATLCRSSSTFKYPKEKLDRLWKLVLLNQFHDVLPGSSIEMVYVDARRIYQDVMEEGHQLLKSALDEVLPGEDLNHAQDLQGITVLNTLGWDRSEILGVPWNSSLESLALKGGGLSLQASSQDPSKGYLRIPASIPAFGIRSAVPLPGSESQRNEDDLMPAQAQFHSEFNTYSLENGVIRATFDQGGHLISLLDLEIDRELVPEGAKGNQLLMYEDQPIYWDAWDVEIYHLQKVIPVPGGKVQIGELGPLKASLIVQYDTLGPGGSGSRCTQEISLMAATSSNLAKGTGTGNGRRLDFTCHVHWKADRQFLKVEFPWDITSDIARYETQFGVVERPTHFNTTLDAAKFEVCGHRWADLSEYGYGVALLNDSKYGYATHGSTQRLSLLRSPKAPDAHCDMGEHTFRYAVYPHLGTFAESDVVRQAHAFNSPMHVKAYGGEREVELSQTRAGLFTLHPIPITRATHVEGGGVRNVVLETVKFPEPPIHGVEEKGEAEEGDKDIIVRMYEAYGGQARFHLKCHLSIKDVHVCNMLEEEEEKKGKPSAFGPMSKVSVMRDGSHQGIEVRLSPFQILTLKVRLGKPHSDHHQGLPQVIDGRHR